MYSTYSKCGLFVLLTFFLSSVTGIAQVNTCACDFAECNNLISNGEFEYVGTEIFDGAFPGIETAHCWFKWDEGTSPHLLETNSEIIDLVLSEELPPELGESNTYLPCIGGGESFYTQTLLPLNSASGPYTLRFYYYATDQSTFAVGFTEDFVTVPSPSDNVFVFGNTPLLYGGNIEAQIGEWVLFEQQININEADEMNFFYVARRYQGIPATIFIDNISITPVIQQSTIPIELEGIETQICQGTYVNLDVLSDIDCPLR